MTEANLVGKEKRNNNNYPRKKSMSATGPQDLVKLDGIFDGFFF